MTKEQNAIAIGLELAPGAFFQTFGIGHMYSGRFMTGLAIMISYWALQSVNTLLMAVWIGFITFPLTWLAYMFFCPTNVIDTWKR